MELEKLQLELYNYITSDRRIKDLEEKKEQVVRRKEAAEFTEKCLSDHELKEFAVSVWNKAYTEELELELKILSIKKEQTEFMLRVMLAN
jgi:hypothetical protein